MLGRPAWVIALALAVAACAGPVQEPALRSGELIAFGGGAGGAADACFTCHGFNGEGDHDSPRLAGLQVGYLIKQLADYSDGRRLDPVMGPVAARMTDRDHRAVAEYYAALASPPRARVDAPSLFAHGDRARGIEACARCHGARGEGQGAAYPAIAGQPAAYTTEQLRRWKRGLRHNDPGDVMGRETRALTEAEIRVLSEYLETAGT